jgi:hypothetical protein
MQNIVKQHPPKKKNKCNDSGIGQMKCLDYPLRYVRQTGTEFRTRYKERILKAHIKHRA